MPLTTSEVERLFGRFTFREGARRGSIIPDPLWVKANIVSVPNGWGLKSPSGKPALIRCHRLVAAKVRAVFEDLYGQGLIGLIVTYDGCYVARHMNWNPARSLSRHSWGICVDVNAGQFPFGSQGQQHPKIISAFGAHGFHFGHVWTVPDPMHAEFEGQL